MKHIYIILMLLVTQIGRLSAQDTLVPPPVEEIAAAYVASIGGEAAWDSIASLQLTGTSAMQGMEFPYVITSAAGGKQRFEVDIQGNKMVQGYDGETAWMYFPMQGITHPRPVGEDESSDLRFTPFPDVSINAAARGYTLAPAAGRQVRGVPTYGVRVTNADGYDQTFYFDAQNMRPVLQTSIARSGPMAGFRVDVYLTDYEDTAGGLVLPMSREQRVNGQPAMRLLVDKVAVNPTLEEGYFSLSSIEE